MSGTWQRVHDLEARATTLSLSLSYCLSSSSFPTKAGEKKKVSTPFFSLSRGSWRQNDAAAAVIRAGSPNCVTLDNGLTRTRGKLENRIEWGGALCERPKVAVYLAVCEKTQHKPETQHRSDGD